jgi:hypothetical protein
LEIENALWQPLLYLRDFMPAEAMFLIVSDPGLGMIGTIARGDYEGGQTTSIKSMLQPEKQATTL